MADGTPGGARLRLENPSESAGPWKADEKTSGKIWKMKEKVLTFAVATLNKIERSSLKDLHIQRVVQVLKKTYRQKKYLSSNKKGILS